ncbi:MAG: TIGR02391 family protein [Planctomycetaceae bacterium]|nr:TIGR02391 family protein [Planctomycetaceae bacterium]
MAELLATIAPGSTRGNTSFSVKKIAFDFGDRKLWKDLSNKKKSIAAFLEQLFRQYPNKPKKIVLEIIRGGVVWTAKKGKTVTPEQLAEISNKLCELGIDAAKEIQQIEIPEPSQIKRPADDLISILKGIDLHPAIADDCIDLFQNGHLNDAVRKALERFEKRIQDITGLHDIGKSLMSRTFNHQSPRIAINDGTSGNDQSEQEGFMLLTMGAMAGLRNLYSHGDVDTIAPMDAFERLCFVSMLFKRVDAALPDEVEEC